MGVLEEYNKGNAELRARSQTAPQQQMSYANTLGQIYKMAETDQRSAQGAYSVLKQLRSMPESSFYNPYAAPTNQAVSNLAALGFDTNNLNKGFIDQNRQWISSNLIYSGTTNTPSKPGKKATAEQKIAYELYQWDRSEADTLKAEQEYQAAVQEAQYWAKRTDRNYSDEDIIGKVKEGFDKKYPTLAKMQNSGFQPLELNRAVDYSDDVLYGAIWAGRNGYDGDMDSAMAYSAMGAGNQWQYDPEIANKLNPESEDFHPYSLGSTNLDEQARYFGVSAFSKQWVKDHENLAFSTDETEKAMYGKVRAAYDNQVKAEQEYDELMKFIDKKVQWANKPEDILSKIDWKKYPTLAAMDKSIGNKDLDILATGDLVPLTEGLKYRYADLKTYVNNLFAEKDKITSIIDYTASMSDKTAAALADIAAGAAAMEEKEKGGKQEQPVASHPTYRPSEQQIEVAKAQDKLLQEDAELTESVNTPAENAVNTTQLSSQYDFTKVTLDQIKTIGGNIVKSLGDIASQGNISSYSGTILGNFDTVSSYEINEKQIADLEAKAEALKGELGDKIYYSEESPERKVVQVTLGGKQYDVLLTWDYNASSVYNEETGEMDRTGSYAAQGIFDHGTNLGEPASGNYTREEYEKAVGAAIEESNRSKEINDKYHAEGLTDEEKEKAKEYNQVVGDLESAKDRRMNGQEAYDKAKKDIEIAQKTQEYTIDMMKKAGLDTRAMEDAAVVTDFFLNFTKYDPTDWQSYNFYHEYSQMLMSGEAGIDEMLKVAEVGDAEIQQAIDVAKTMLEYADEKGMAVPDNVRENITRYIESLERQHQDYDYMSYMKNDDFQEKARAGAERVQNTEFDWDAYGKTGTLESQPLWSVLSEEQKNILRKYEESYKNGDSSSEYLVNAYAAIAAGLSLNRTFNELGFATGSYLASDIMNDYEQATFYYLLETQGTEAAEAYYDHLANGSYGVLNKRAAEKTQAAASDLASKGFWGRRAADALSVLLSPIAALGSVYYAAEYGIKKLSGERVEFNPNNVNLTANIYKKEARAKINEEIIKEYGEGTVLQKLMSGLQEIISTRLDSMMNAAVFGPLFKGIGSDILQEFLSASPMALTAATDAVAEAKENGVADDVKLLGIFASTFIAEAGTEAISLENMKQVFQGAKDLTLDGISDFMRNWLTNSGISEMVGETFTEAWEQEWNKALLGENSDYEKMWRKIHDEEKVSEKEAKLRASRELMGQVLHTALISYITPGADIISYGAGRFAAYRGRARELQESGKDYSVLDVYREYKKERQRNNVDQPVVENEASDQEAGTAVPETTPEAPAQTTKEAPAQTADELAKSLTLDYEILESARNADISSQTASVASVLDVDGTDLSSDEANAAAANIPGLFGENTTPAEGLQTLIIGCHANGVDADTVKQAIRTAALDNESAAYQMMQTEEYQDADPGERAEMLASTVETDANDAGVQSRVARSIYENRVARAEKEAVNSPEVSQKQKAAYDAQGKLLDAQKETEAAQTYSDQKNALVRAAAENLQAVDPTDNAALNKAINELQSATAVAEEEAKPRLANAKEAERKAQEALDRAVEDIANKKRQIAEQMVAEQDQQRADAKQQAEIDAAVQEEQEEKQRISQEESDNAHVADVEGFIAQQEAQYGPMSEEEKQRVRERFESFRNDQSQELPVQTQPDQNQQDQEGDAFGAYNDPAAQNRRKAAKEVSRRFGIEIVPIDTKKAEGFYSEGYYDEANNRIVLDSKHVTVDDIMYRVLGHELLHVAKLSKMHKPLFNSIARIFYGQDADIDQAIKNLKKNKGVPTSQLEANIMNRKQDYDRQFHKNHSYEFAAEEHLADRMGQIINQSDDAKRQDLVNRLVADDPSVARRLLDSIKSFLKKAVGMKGAWLSNSQKTVDLLEKALTDAQNNSRDTAKWDTDEHGEIRYDLKRVENLKEDDAYDLLERVSFGEFEDKSFIPVRRSTPAILIAEVNRHSKGEKVIENLPMISEVGHLRRDMESSEGSYNKELRPHDISANEMIDIIKGMSDPAYIVYQNSNNRYVEIVSYYGENGRGRKSWAVVDFDRNVNKSKLNGYNGGTYHVLVTPFEPDNFDSYLRQEGREIIYDKTKDAVDRGYSRQWLLLNDTTPFDDEMVTREQTSVKRSLPSENDTIVSDDDGNPLATELPGGTVALDTGKKYSLASFTPEEQTKVRNALLKSGRFTSDQVDQYMNDALGLASMIAADRDRLDYEADPEKTMLKPNAEYVKTLDASTLCAKRLLYQGTFDAIQHALPNTPLMPEDLIDLSNMMREMGYETPCGICYVESRRRQLGKFTEQWLDSYDGEYKPTLDEVTTSDGLEALRTSHPQAYQDFINAMNKKGTMNPKVVQLRTDYRGEIRDMTPGQIQKVKDIGGLRVQSFSDFETPHLLDMAQAVMDMAAKGLTAQAYTKVPNFPWAFGDTGIKINLSLIGKGNGVDENGNLIFDDVEGMPFEEAMKLRDRYSQNVGTILVGINDQHILAAMADPRIDFIIPFHKSGWSKNELDKMPVLNGYSDYTDSQNEKLIVGKDKKGNYKTESLDKSKRVNFQPVGENGYWDFSKTGKENAEAYLKMCAEDGRLPKFSQFLVDNGDGSFSLQPDGSTDGYWKTLIDFKMYDNDGVGAPQQEVTPNINMPQAQRILNEYSLDRGNITRKSNNDLPVAQPVVDRYVEEYKANHPLDENRVKYSLPSDAPYMAAVERGEMEEAQRIIDDRAVSAGYTLEHAFHGSDDFGFTEFDMDRSQNEIFVAYSKDVAGTYTEANGVRNISERSGIDYQGLSGDEIANLFKENVPRAYGGDVVDTKFFTRSDLWDRVINDRDALIAPLEGIAFSSDEFERVKLNIATLLGVGVSSLDDARTPAELQYKVLGNLLEYGSTYSRRIDILRNMFKPFGVSTSVADSLIDKLNEDYATWQLGEDVVEFTLDSGETYPLRRQKAIQYIRQATGDQGGIYDLYTKEGKQLVIDAHNSMWSQIPWKYVMQAANSDFDAIDEYQYDDHVRTRDISRWAKANGYDSVRINNVEDNGAYSIRDNVGDIGIFFNQEDVKSADTVTYDENGEVIPPSERFGGNRDMKNDLRYSLPSDDILDQQIQEYLNRGGSLSTNTPQAVPQAAPANPQNGFRQWGNEGAQESDELDEKAKQYVLNSEYARDTNAAEMSRALKWVRGNKQFADDDGFQESMRIVTDKHFNYRTKDGQARMVAVMALAVARGDVGAQVQLADAYNQQGTDLGQALQARKLFRLMTPQGRIATLQKMVGNVQQQLDSKGIQKEIRLSDWIYQAASEATEEGTFAKIQQAAAAELAEQIPANWKDKLRSLRMLSMLGNPRTHIRNIIGNALFIPAVSLKNKLGAIGEIASNKITGSTERTKTLSLKLSKEISDFARQDAEFMRDDLTGESKYNEGSMVQRQQKPFKGFIQSLIDFNSNALEGEDWFFLKGHYRRALGGWMQANGYTVDQLKNDTNLLEQGRAYAINEAQKATYRDFNGLADRLNKLSRNPQTTGEKVLGFATEAILPFKKTPANILKRGLEYSPAGLVRGIKNAMVDVKSGKITAAQAIDRICSGLAGTAILALGAFLGHAGVVTCGLGDDDDKFEKEQGNQKYAVRLNLFGQDITYTMDWAAPMSMPFFVGAAIENQINKDGELDINEIMDAMGNIAEPVLNLSMLDGVNTLFKTSQSGDTDAITQIGAKVASNYVTSYVPSLIGAIARTIDDTRRANFVESGKGGGVTGTFRYAMEQTENKIPGLSQTNIPVRDVFGNAETSSLAERIFENFISPGYITQYKNDPVLNEMARLYDANVTGSKDMIPKDPAKTVTYNKQKYVFSAEEWDRYKEVRGKTAYKLLTDLMKNSDYQNAEESVQVQMIKSAWDYADKAGKAAVIPGFKMSTKDKNPAASVARDGKITGYKNKMLAALEDGDYEGYEAMVEGLREEDIEDSEIKSKISGKYRDLYKDAYLTGDYGRMNEIEEILDSSGFDFDYDAWQNQVDEKR